MAPRSRNRIEPQDDPSSLTFVYHSDRLITPDGMHTALQWFLEQARSDRNLVAELRLLARVPSVLALLVSANYGRMRPILETALFDIFPSERDLFLSTDPQTYIASVTSDVLPALAHYFSTIAPPSSVDAELYRKHNFSVPRVDIAIEAVILIDKDDKSRRSFTWEAARAACDDLEVAYPQTDEEATDLAVDLLMSLRSSAEWYIDILGNQQLAQRIRTAFFQMVEAPHPTEALLPKPPAVVEISISDDDPSIITRRKDSYPITKPDHIRPYIDSPEGFGDWYIYISSAAVKHLREFLRKDMKSFQIVQKKIVELSQGLFSASNQQRLVGGPEEITIFEAKVPGGMHLVYQIDLQADPDLQFDRQVIVIHGVYTHSQFDHRLWERVAKSLPKNDREYRQRCNYRVIPRVHGVVNMTTPMIWEHTEPKIVPTLVPTQTFTEEEYLELHKMLSLEKFVPFSTAVLRSIMNDVDSSHAFKVSPTETRIINYESSCFVIGRSGTGKTTTMLFKLLGVERAKFLSQDSGRDNRRYRQVFLTQSHILAQRVQEYYGQLTQAANLGLAAPSTRSVDTQDLFNIDEEADARSDLPARYSELTDNHFPLFITYDQVRKMLENDHGLMYTGHKSTLRRKAATGTIAIAEPADDALGIIDTVDDAEGTQETAATPYSQQLLITFNSFCDEYWPHLDQRLTKGLDPALVFSEIMGVISGNEATLETKEGYLDRAAYLALSTRAFNAFATQRPRVYDIFEKYRGLKTRNAAYDSPDRTHAILRAMGSEFRGNIDFLYIDEVQDLLTIDTKLLRRLCRNPHGFFWGGDTAQTISVGSSFRFEDLKALHWREENEDPFVAQGERKPVRAETFELLVNYRSHGGIVDCAGSIISLISALFPYSIDKLQKESAVVSGPKPCVFRGWDNDVVHFEQFLFGQGDSRVDFGARQVILVRSDEVRDRLRNQLGDAGLILTLLESKGLEFDDVLLYGFFESSPATASQWRVVLSVLPSESNAPVPDPVKHAVINSELKHLYVGITRARHHCWIWDSNERANSMVKFWQAKRLVKVQGPDEPIPQLAAVSTPEEWNSTGRYLFAKGLYAQAASCFEKANRPQDHDIAVAYQKRKDARRMETGARRRQAFKVAGEAFSACGYAASGEVARGYHRLAIPCFSEANEPALAAQSHAAASEQTVAAKMFRDLGNFDEAINLVKPKKGVSLVAPDVGQQIIELARLEYLRVGRIDDASALFGSAEEQLQYLNDYGFSAAQKVVLKNLGQFDTAAELHLRDGETREAAETWLQSGSAPSKQRAVSCLLDGLWSQAFGADLSLEGRALYTLLKRMAVVDLSRDIREQVEMFSAIVAQDVAQLIDLGNMSLQRNVHCATLCFDHALRHPPQLQSSSLRQMSSRLKLIAAFVTNLTHLLKETEFCQSPDIAKLMGFKPALDSYSLEPLPDEYRIAAGSYLKRRVLSAHDKELHVSSVDGGDITVQGRFLNSVIRTIFENRVRHILQSVHQSLIQAPILRPCPDAALNGACHRNSCDQDHTSAHTIETARARHGVHMQLILVLDKMRLISWPSHVHDIRRDVKRTWIERMYSTLFPISYHLGNDQIVSASSVPESVQALSVLKDWIQERCYELHPTAQEDLCKQFLSASVVVAMLAFRVHGSRLPGYFPRAAGLLAPREDLLPKGGSYSITTTIINFYGWESETSLTSGISFVRHVIMNDVQIDGNVLLHLIEQISLDIIMNDRQRDQNPFHNLMLPRSWILQVIRRPKRSIVQRPSLTWFLEGMRHLFPKILDWDRSGAEFLLDSKDSPRGRLIKNILMSRLCRTLVLIGQNARRSSSERTKIGEVITSIRTRGPHDELYNRYVQACDWKEMVLAVYDSTAATELDEVILLELASPHHTQTPTPLRRITFTALTEVENALTYERVLPALVRIPVSGNERAQSNPSLPTSLSSVSPPSKTDSNPGGKRKKKKKNKGKGNVNANEAKDLGTPTTPILPPKVVPKPESRTTEKFGARERSLSESDSEGLPQLVPIKMTKSSHPAKQTPSSTLPASGSKNKKSQLPDDSDSDGPPPLIPFSTPKTTTALSYPPKSDSAGPAHKIPKPNQECGRKPQPPASDESDSDSLPPLVPLHNSKSKPKGGTGARANSSKIIKASGSDSDSPPPLVPLASSRRSVTSARDQKGRKSADKSPRTAQEGDDSDSESPPPLIPNISSTSGHIPKGKQQSGSSHLPPAQLMDAIDSFVAAYGSNSQAVEMVMDSSANVPVDLGYDSGQWVTDGDSDDMPELEQVGSKQPRVSTSGTPSGLYGGPRVPHNEWTDDEGTDDDMDPYGQEDSDELPPLEPVRRASAPKTTSAPKVNASAKSISSNFATPRPPLQSSGPSKPKSSEAVRPGSPTRATISKAGKARQTEPPVEDSDEPPPLEPIRRVPPSKATNTAGGRGKPTPSIDPGRNSNVKPSKETTSNSAPRQRRNGANGDDSEGGPPLANMHSTSKTVPKSRASSKTNPSTSATTAPNIISTGTKVDTLIGKPIQPPTPGKPAVSAQANAKIDVTPARVPANGGSAATSRTPAPNVPFRAGPQDDEPHALEELEDQSHIYSSLVSIEMPRTPQEIRAVRVLQQWSRRRLQSRARSKTDSAELERIYSTCSSHVSRLPIVGDRLSHVRHVAIVRGPLPHVILVLEKLLAFVRVAKDESQRRIRNALHQELDKVLASMAQLTSIHKALTAIWKRIQPSSTKFAVGEVKAAVRELERILRDASSILRPVDLDKIKDDWELGRKGISDD